MNHQIRSHARGEFPKVPSDTAGEESLVGDPLTLELTLQLLGIANRKDDPAPARVVMESDQEIPADESGGTGQKEFHKIP